MSLTVFLFLSAGHLLRPIYFSSGIAEGRREEEGRGGGMGRVHYTTLNMGENVSSYRRWLREQGFGLVIGGELSLHLSQDESRRAMGQSYQGAMSHLQNVRK